MMASMVNNAAEALRRGQGRSSYSSTDGALFMYSTKMDNPELPEVTADGKPLEKTAGVSVLTAELSYASVGRTGVVFRSAGMDIPVRVETDDNQMPTDEIDQSGKNMYYHSLSETPTFRFTIDGLQGVRVDSLQVVVVSYYVSGQHTKAYALNAGTGEWEEIGLNETIPDPGRYLDEKGRLFLQFRPNTADMYADIPTPMINLEGRLENAEN